MEFIDFHAHHASLRGEKVIQDGTDTRGRHPWHLIDAPHSLIFSFPHFPIAIGESGLDRMCDTPYDLQLEVFREEVKLSEEVQKPLFLHCVKAIDDVLAIRREMNARQPWIWHGFRGNAHQLQQLLPYGFWFSFGIRFNEEALAACPQDRLLLETDEDTTHPIGELYERVAKLRNIPLESLVMQMHENYNVLFCKQIGI